MPAGLEPFVPSPADPWDTAKAAHLLRRTGFGPLPSEIDAAVAAGPDRAVEALFAFPPAPAAPPIFDEVRAAESHLESVRQEYVMMRMPMNPKDHPELRALFQEVNRANIQAVTGLTSWWLDRMARGPAPLQERLTLFWHGHFTSSLADVQDIIAMYNQNQLYRQHAAGNFARLLEGVARDPAMLRYLNNEQNKRGHPNENWARELMELFTMGIGHYTEEDIKESARAWTGWTLRDHRTFEGRRTFWFSPGEHDGGIKTFFGQTGTWDGTDIMQMILTRPETPRWVAGRLAQFFVSPQPSPAVVEGMAQQIRANNYELRPALRALFRSQAFYRPEVVHAQIKSPTEFVVGAVRQLGIQDPDWLPLQRLMANMGQRLFFPPNVAGWHGGTMWMNASTVFNRTDVAAALLAGRFGTPDLSGFSSPEAAAARLLQRPLPAPRRAILAQAGSGGMSPSAQSGGPNTRPPALGMSGDPDEIMGAIVQAAQAGRSAQAGPGARGPALIAHLVMSLPEYQVC